MQIQSPVSYNKFKLRKSNRLLLPGIRLPKSCSKKQRKKAKFISKRLLNNIDKLESLAPQKDTKISSVIKCFYTFNEVRQKCFGNRCLSGYKEAIKDFENNYSELELSTTPKLHALFEHVPQFLERQEGHTGLGPFSEQASE